MGGLTTLEIAKAFFVPEATMAQRISRAKQSIKESGVPFEMPATEERRSRVGAVAHVLYLIFNEGYAASSGTEVVRTNLSGEALRLTRLLLHLGARRRRGRMSSPLLPARTSRAVSTPWAMSGDWGSIDVRTPHVLPSKPNDSRS